MIVMTDGFNEVNARLTQECKQDIWDRYPMHTFAHLPKALDRMIISSDDYSFKMDRK